MSGQHVNGDVTHPLLVLLVSSTDHITGVTGLSSATILAGTTIKKNGGAPAAAAGSYVSRNLGSYAYTPIAGEVDTNGWGAITISGVAGCDPYDEKYQVVSSNFFSIAAEVWDALTSGHNIANTFGNILGNTSSIGTLATTMKAQVVAALASDTYPEAAGVPVAASTLAQRLVWIGTLARNKILQTSSGQSVRNDGDTATIATAPVSDDGTTFTRGEFA